MPYAYAGRWHRSGYTISNQMTRTSTSKTDLPMVSYEFVFDPELVNITNEDMDAILGALQINTRKRIEVKTMIKDTVFKVQDTYLQAHTALEEMKKFNRDTKAQIAEQEKKLKATITLITKYNVEMAVLIKLKETQTVNVQNLTTQLLDLNEKLKQLMEILRTQKLELKNFKKTDISTETAYLNQQSAIMSYSKVAPLEFKKEYGIAVTNKQNNVNTNYEKCNNQVANAMACNSASMNTSLLKKLRKGFF